VALYVRAFRRGRGGLALVGLALAASIKLTGAVPAAYGLLAALAAAAGPRLDTPLGRRVAVALAGLGGAALLFAFAPWLRTLTNVIGTPADLADHCTMRQLECAARFGLRFLFSAHRAAFGLGLVFRAASLAFLLWAALRGAAPERRLSTLALFFGLYFLVFGGWSQSWYYLPLLALLPFAAPAHQRLLGSICVSAVAFYPTHLLFGCDEQPPLPPWVEGVAGAVQVTLANLPVIILGWLDRRRA
jgi:hypothetical protein